MIYSFEKRVVIKKSQMTVEKYFFPPKTINFSTVYDISETVIQTDGGNILLQGMKNAEEIKTIFQEIMESSEINDE